MWLEAQFFLFFNQSTQYILSLKRLKVPEEADYNFLLFTGDWD